MADATYDVVIAGGGVVGSAIAYFLAADPAFAGTVAVVERDPSYQTGSTGRSAGGLRQQFSTPVNIRISRFGADFLRAVPDLLAVDGDRPDPAFREIGYLFLASAAGLSVLESNLAVQRAEGAHIARLDPADLAARFPWINVEGIAAGALGLRDEGYLDPHALLMALRRKARDLGAVYLGDAVTAVARDGGRITGVTLAGGAHLACGTLVNAAGAAAARVAAMAGLDLPVRPRKRFVYVIDCRTPVPGLPLTIDTNGVWVRPEGAQFICGVSPPAEADPDCTDFEVDETLFHDVIWPTLAHRVPAFEAVKLVNAWAGHYAYNTLDQNAVLGPHPEVPNFLFANGFSGHGLQQSPAVGRGIAEWIIHGAWRTLDLSPLGYARIVAGQPLREANVV
ncbi:MAG: FAD-binding oxidoreductase [Hyphomicrobiales bacterium]|nr:FAD-binding oxidoreductase [Hyphomicrobiales bacterium]